MGYSVKYVISAIDKVTSVVRGINKAFGTLKQSAAMAKFNESINRVGQSIRNVGRETGLFIARLGTLAVAGGYLFKNLFLDTATQFEKFRTILETTEDSSEKAKKAMAWVQKFARTTPYELAEVTDAFVKMRAYGMDPTQGMLKSLGDTSAAMGKPLMQAVEAMADAVTGENERLKEFGIKARVAGNKIKYEYTKNGKTMVKEANKSSREQIQATLMGIFNEKYAGAMDKLSKTWGGMMSNIGDTWTNFANMVMEAGVFDFMKGELSSFMDSVNRMGESGELKKIALQVANELKTIFGELKTAVIEVWPVIKQIGGAIAGLAKSMGGYGNLLKGVIALMAVPWVISIVQMIATIGGFIGSIQGLIVAAGGWSAIMGTVGGAIMALSGPIGWTIAAITIIGGLAAVIWANWQPITQFFTNFWTQYGNLIKMTFPILGVFGSYAQILITLWQPVQAFFMTLFNFIVDKAGAAVQAVQALAGAAASVANVSAGVNPNIKGPGAGYKAPAGLSSLPGRAGGGWVARGKRYKVGEKGQEEFVPHTSGHIIPNDQMAAGGAGDQIFLHLKIDAPGPVQVVKQSTKGRKTALNLDMGWMTA